VYEVGKKFLTQERTFAQKKWSKLTCGQIRRLKGWRHGSPKKASKVKNVQERKKMDFCFFVVVLLPTC
jgi:hypothetical protein